MKVTTERIPEAQMVLEVEIDDERVQKSLDQAAKRLTQRYRIPGFRKGRAPRAIVEQTLGADAVFEEAIDRLIPQVYDEAVKGEGLEPIGPPHVESVDRDPVRFRARIPLEPSVDLGDYTTISARQEPVAVTDEDVAAAVLEIQRQHAVLEPVDRAVQLNDRIKADIHAEVEGKTALDETEAEFHVREDMVLGVPGVDGQLLGLSVGGPHSFTIDTPADWDDEDVAGKPVTFEITIHEIKREILPEADDDLAQEVGEFDTFDALRTRVGEDLRTRGEQSAKEAFSQRILEALLDRASVDFPPLLVDHEVEHMLQELARQTGQDAEAILKSQGASAQQLRENVRAEALERVRRSLLLDAVAEAEQVAIDEDAIDAEITRVAGEGLQAERMREILNNENGRNAIRRNLLTTRTLDRLGEIAHANASLEAEAAAEDTGATAPDDADG